VPPLRDRGEDNTLLAKVFLTEAEADVGRQELTFTPDALEALRDYAWPGNVRELRNVILRAAATAPEPLITARDLFLEAAVIDRSPAASRVTSRTLREAVVRSERDALLGALNACAWNFARTANHLGISRMTLYRLLQKCNISRSHAQS
jgi:DNA-binding NtrC family response regulator